MNVFGDEITIQQGEDFNMDITLSSSSTEYIPFIISSERKNPFFVITIASTKYEKNMRYVVSYWNNPFGKDGIPTFYQTVPVNIGEIEKSRIPSQVGLLPSPYDLEETAERRYLYQFTLAEEEVDEDLGHKPYHYLYFVYNDVGNLIGSRLDQYECKIIQNFNSDITRHWSSQNYVYQITLVSGDLLADVILQKCSKELGKHPDIPVARDENGVILDPQPIDYLEAQFEYIKRTFPDYLQPDVDVDSPLGTIEISEPILEPTKLTVKSSIRQTI